MDLTPLTLFTIEMTVWPCLRGFAPSGELLTLITDRTQDRSRRLITALQKSQQRAWRTVEMALSGDSFWRRCRDVLSPSEDRALRDQIRQFVASLGDEAVRERALKELRQLRQKGLLDHGPLTPETLAREAGHLGRFEDPAELLNRERTVLHAASDELTRAGFESIGLVLAPTESGPGLLVTASRYFFRRAIERDEHLFRGVTFAHQEGLAAGQEEGFATLEKLFREHGEQLDSWLGEVREAVLDMRAELHTQGEQGRDIYEAVLGIRQRLDMARIDVRPQDSLSIRGDEERQLIKDLIRRYRELPESQRRDMPALLNGIGQLEVAAGMFREAEQDFLTVARIVGPDEIARGEAHMNAYHAALEAREWVPAMRNLLEAVRIDAKRFAPFPMGTYKPRRILGAGGFGCVFLCQHKRTTAPVVVKALFDAPFGQRIEGIFNEAQLLGQVSHPNIVKVHDCQFTDRAGSRRAYIVMDHFDGISLADHVAQHGKLAHQEWCQIGKQVAEALRAAHQKGVLHRDVKPGNILIRREESGLRAMVIDFGLAMPATALRQSISRRDRSLAGSTIVGTLDFAAPEQIGKLEDVPVGRCADIYGFGKTACHTLFQTTLPGLDHWRSVPEPLAQLLSRCVRERPEERPQSFDEIIQFFDNRDKEQKPEVILIEARPVRPTPPPAAPLQMVQFQQQSRVQVNPGHSPPPPVRKRRRRVVDQDDDFDDGPGFRCPHCSSRTIPVTRSKISGGGWAVFITLLLLCWPFCFIGLFMQNKYLACGECGTKLS